MAGRAASAQTSVDGESSLQNRESQQYASKLGFNAGVSANKSYGPYGDGAPSTGATGAPGGSRAGPVMGSRRGGLDVGAGFNANTAQSLVDTATNKSGATSKQDQQQAAKIVSDAVKDVMADTKDAGVRGAARSFDAAFQQATRASEQTTASVSQDASAGSAQQQGMNNQVGGSFALGAPVARELLAMAGGDPAHALQLAQDPNAVAAATVAAGGSMQQAAARDTVLDAGGAQAPASPAAVQAQGNADVGALAAQGRGQVAAAHAHNQSEVATRQPADPMSAPDTSPAAAAFQSASAAAFQGYQDFKADAGLQAGATKAAAALYNAEQKGAGTVMSNAFLAGWGYESPAQYQGALMEAAAERPRLANTLRHIGEGGGQVSPAAMDFIQSEVKAYKDSKE